MAAVYVSKHALGYNEWSFSLWETYDEIGQSIEYSSDYDVFYDNLDDDASTQEHRGDFQLSLKPSDTFEWLGQDDFWMSCRQGMIYSGTGRVKAREDYVAEQKQKRKQERMRNMRRTRFTERNTEWKKEKGSKHTYYMFQQLKV